MKLLNLVENKYFYILSVLVFFLPLTYSRSTNELFEFPKMFFVYFAGTILVTAFAVEVILRSTKIKKIAFLPLVYLFTFLLSVIFSSHIYTSLWGYYTRFNDGLLSVCFFIFIYFVIKNVLSKTQTDALLKISVTTLIPAGIISIAQHYGISALWSSTPVERAFSTFGQPNWFAQYVVLILPLSIYYYVFDRNSLFWFTTSVIGFAGTWFSYSLSGLLGLLISLLIFALLLTGKILTDRGKFKKIVILFTIYFLIGVLNPGLLTDRFHDLNQDIHKFFVITPKVYAQELSGTSEYRVSDPGFIRSGLWQGTLNLIFSSPKVFLIGTGPETYPYEFQPFRTGDINYSSEWNFVMNKPHNYYLEIWSEQGILGLFTYILLIFWLYMKTPYKYKPGLAGFYVTNIFGWPTVATSLLFWILLAGTEADK
ncbi:hypothetical protein C4561_04100 [candidate division WWE3 bacterium]|jgi:O-antigen ligase|uniref:O-antigen ligase-related domain-containing protein n=1 Tax=candidate division WWE3 bacterium TaxID=2053526 RepID=A0A3A4ZCP9_UNCKA|nr:MAG: hypothetical protein C4561_04100 [candidate division WWE3 bacterium]